MAHTREDFKDCYGKPIKEGIYQNINNKQLTYFFRFIDKDNGFPCWEGEFELGGRVLLADPNAAQYLSDLITGPDRLIEGCEKEIVRIQKRKSWLEKIVNQTQ